MFCLQSENHGRSTRFNVFDKTMPYAAACGDEEPLRNRGMLAAIDAFAAKLPESVKGLAGGRGRIAVTRRKFVLLAELVWWAAERKLEGLGGDVPWKGSWFVRGRPRF